MADGKAFRLKDRSGLAEHGTALLVGEASPRARPSQLALPGDPADSFWKRLKGMGRAFLLPWLCVRARVSFVPCEKMSQSFGSLTKQRCMAGSPHATRYAASYTNKILRTRTAKGGLGERLGLAPVGTPITP